MPRTDLTDLQTIKGCNLVRCACLLTLFGVKAALAVEVGAAANHIEVARKKQRMGTTAADVDDILIEDIKSVNSRWNASSRNFLVSQLAKIIATPRVHVRRLNSLIPLLRCQSLLLEAHCNCHREVLAAR